MNSKRFSLRDRFKSLKFAINGIKLLVKNEHNARIHLVATILVIIVCCFLPVNAIEVSLLAISIGLVFISELLNTAIENIANFVEPQWNKKIGEIKDYSAGAVLISAMISLIIAAAIILPKVLDLVIQ